MLAHLCVAAWPFWKKIAKFFIMSEIGVSVLKKQDEDNTYRLVTFGDGQPSNLSVLEFENSKKIRAHDTEGNLRYEAGSSGTFEKKKIGLSSSLMCVIVLIVLISSVSPFFEKKKLVFHHHSRVLLYLYRVYLHYVDLHISSLKKKNELSSSLMCYCTYTITLIFISLL